MSGDASGISSADPAALRVYVRVTRDMDQEMLAFARGPLRIALTDFRAACPEAARNIPDLDLLCEQLALRGLRLSDMVERVAADFEAAGQGPDLVSVVRPEVAGDLGALAARPIDSGLPDATLASLSVDPPLSPIDIPRQDPRDLVGDFLGGLWDEVSGTVDSVVHLAHHPSDLFEGVLAMLENPGDALRALVDWDDLESGHPGRWAGHMLPGTVLGVFTGGTGLLVRTARILHRWAENAAALPETVATLARELGEGAARQLAVQLGRSTSDALLRAMMPSEIRRFVDHFGVEGFRELVRRYTAESVAHYGFEFFKEFRGVTDNTMRHVVHGEGIRDGEIVGCHDEDEFRRAILGSGEVLSEKTDPLHPEITSVEYKLYRRAADRTVTQPPTLASGKPKRKTLVKGMAADADKWKRTAQEAVDEGIRSRRLPKNGGLLEARSAGGTDLLMYYRFPEINTFFPK